MPKTALVLFSFVAGALLSDFTHPAGQRFWQEEVNEAITDSDFGCTDDCLEEEEPRLPLTCWAAKTHVRCEVVEAAKMPPAIIDWQAIAAGLE